MKKGIYAFLAVLIVFALAMMGCPNDSDDGGTTTYTVTFITGEGGSTVAPITGVKSGATITRPATPTKSGQSFAGWGKDEAGTALWNFDIDTVTKNTTLYAQWIPSGSPNDATLNKIVIAGLDLDEVTGASFGEPDTDLEYVGPGIFEPGIPQPEAGVSIAVTAKNTSAAVKWLVKGSAPTEAEFTASENTTPATFVEGDKLYIKVVSANESRTNYYIIQVYFVDSQTIYYGQPVINGTTIDPLWEANYHGPVFNISRVNTNEQTPPFRFFNTVDGASGNTLGKAKVLWDDNGLYVYTTVEYHDYYASEEDKAAGTVTERVTNMIGNYQSDSLEIFTNLRYQKLTDETYDLAQQFRVGFSDGSLPGDTFTSNSGGSFVVGGNQRNMAGLGIQPDNQARWAFQQSGEFYAWITKNGEKETGYKVLAKVPWYLIGYDDTNDVFDANGLVKNDAKIGLEFQLNVSVANGERDALLTANGISTQAVTNVTNYAVVTLARGSATRVVKTNAPNIGDLSFTPEVTAEQKLSARAFIGPKAPTPVLSYQWYSAADAAAAGTAIAGATAATYDTPADGTFYYVTVTNTNSAAAAGFTTASVTSRRIEYKAPTAPTGEDYVVDLTGQTTANTTEWNSTYNNGLVIDVRQGGQPVSRDAYGKFTIVVKFYSDAAHTTAVTTVPQSALQMKWFTGVPTNCNGSGNYGDAYNFGTTPSVYTNANLLGTNQAIDAIGIQTSGGNNGYVPFIVIESITFHAK
jgi:uncharacterized repeat protein (TIGR02543 family)